MAAVAAFVRFAETINDYVGRIVGWLTLATVLICATVVFIRYVLSTGFVWMQELYVWTHAGAFMLGAGYTLLADKHVRVDILYARRSERTRAWLDLVGTIVFLFPWILVLTWYSWTYVLNSWKLMETSQQVGGMPGLYVLKTAILSFCFLMFLQGLAICGRCILVLADQGDRVPRRPIFSLGQ